MIFGGSGPTAFYKVTWGPTCLSWAADGCESETPRPAMSSAAQRIVADAVPGRIQGSKPCGSTVVAAITATEFFNNKMFMYNGDVALSVSLRVTT